MAASLLTFPAPLGDPALSARAVPADWFRIVSTGDLDRLMPPFPSLTVEERWDVVAYAMGIGVGQAEASRGREVYDQKCADCHGPPGSLRDLPEGARSALLSLVDLAAAVRDGVEPGMPAFGGVLSEADVEAAARYVRDLTLASSTGSAASPAGSAAILVARGTISNGTRGGVVLGRPRVTLHVFDGEQLVHSASTTAERSGDYRFDSVPAAAGSIVVTSVEHEGVVYPSQALARLGDEAALDLPITVYEPTVSAEHVRIEQLHLLFDFPAPGTLQVVEVLSVQNTGDRSVVAGDHGPSLSVPLPQGIFHLDWEDANAERSFRRTEQGFDVLLPLRPGRAAGTIVFRFELPYHRGLSFRQPVERPVDGGLILVPRGGPRLSGPGIGPQGVREVEGTQVEVYQVGPLEPGGELAIQLTGTAPGARGSAAAVVLGAAALAVSGAMARRWLRVAG